MSGSIRPVERPETILMPVHEIQMFTKKHQLANQVSTKPLQLLRYQKCAVPLRHHHPSAGRNRPSGGNRE
jgi:hypothetical protein